MRQQLRQPIRNSNGFSLIEMMLVVAIIGLLASIAIPGFKILVMKSKQAERQALMRDIAHAVVSVYQQNGKFSQDMFGGGESITVGDRNPPAPITGLKKAWVKNQPGWSELDWEPTGNVYFHYSFTGYKTWVGPYVWVDAESDLDGDGNESWVELQLVLDWNGYPVGAEQWTDFTPGEW